jgi:hypothetical protein
MKPARHVHIPLGRRGAVARLANARSHGVAVVAIALAALGLAAGASAQFEAGEDTGLDTTFTPRAKDTTAWIQVAGAEYGVDAFPETSPTPVEVEFYAVAFENDTHGFAAGMRCKVAPPSDLTGNALSDYLEDCDGKGREPVIYEYVKTETQESWRPVLPAEGDGYVGAIAFMRDGRAIAVGGTGEYPKREGNPSSPQTDVAGTARAWLYDGGFWTEVGDDRMLPGMRGLTAVGFSQRVGDCGDDRFQCGLAGGYRQLWVWKDGRFTTGWDTTAPGERSPAANAPISDPGSFRFRVRQVEFPPDMATEPGTTKAIAVTSGCCDTLPTRNLPAGLVFDGERLHPKEYSAPTNPSGDDPVVRRDIPDSFYSFTSRNGTISVVATPGGEPSADAAAGDKASRVYGPISIPQPGEPFGTSAIVAATVQLPRQAISTMRLMGGAGSLFESGAHILDWAVGSIDGDRGVAYNADRDLGVTGNAIDIKVLRCPGRGWGAGDVLLGGDSPDLQCQPYDVPDGYSDQLRPNVLFRLPSYALNAMAFTDETESIGWAVGDRGAIVRYGGIGTSVAAGSEPDPAKVGSGSFARFVGADVYAPFRPMSTGGATGSVPSLVANGTTERDEPELVARGAPNPANPASQTYPAEDVSAIAMSRDGSEGWAIGAGGSDFTILSEPSGPPLPTLYHYNGTRWSRCDAQGVPNLLPADPACAGLEHLFGAPGRAPIVLRHLARVPLENDNDPSNNDEFELFALGAEYDPPGPLPRGPVVARYRDGRWALDEVAHKQLGQSGLVLNTIISVAFTAPNDGWITTDGGVRLAHWDGDTWSDCNVAGPDLCGDDRDRLPLSPDGAKVTAVGDRTYFSSRRTVNNQTYPAILYRDRDGTWTSQNGGYDPACNDAQPGCVARPVTSEQRGGVLSLAVSQDFRHGWAIGLFGEDGGEHYLNETGPDAAYGLVSPAYQLLRLTDGVWAPYREDDAARDYLLERQAERRLTPVILDSSTGAAAIYAVDVGTPGPGVLIFEPGRGRAGRWRVLQTPFHNRTSNGFESSAMTRAFVPDGAGGAWLAARQRHTTSGEREAVHFWHYSHRVPNPVFEEAPHPVRERITGGAAGRDGAFWITTNSGTVYRYDRITGWDRLRVPGWDPGRVVTRASEANAVAVGADGEGLLVGKNGRIADISPLGVRLDPAAGRVCGNPPCGTGRDLRAVAVAPDGSALAGGDASVLLYRPPEGHFQRVDFGGSDKASITAISMPTPDHAWLTNSAGQIYVGRLTADGWTFLVENRAPGGRLLSYDGKGALLPLRAIDIDARGEGYAVGERGLILERRATGDWRRIKTNFLDTLHSVTLAPGGRQEGVLVGGAMGLILTLEDGEFRAAREADLFDPLNYGPGSSDSARVEAVALVPGTEDGEVEAWAVQQGRNGPGAVLHYASDPDNLLLRPGGRVDPLPDTPDPRPGEISFAAFGRSECHTGFERCSEGHSANLFHEVVARRVANEVIERGEEPGGPAFAVFTGDVGKAGGSEENPGTGSIANTPLDKSWVHRRWIELVANRLFDAGVPTFGAIGRNDLDRTSVCTDPRSCTFDAKTVAAGRSVNWGWRKAMAEMPAPWGGSSEAAEPVRTDDFDFSPVDQSGLEDPVVGHARTHYAVDLNRTVDGRSTKVARLIFLDNSMGTLQASDPNQNPIEPDGGQLAWLERTLADVDHNGGQQPIVVMNVPTYSYAAGDPTAWAGDSFPLETRFMQNRVRMVVSGGLGWNGRFWATAPGVHHPCPDGAYLHDDDAPEPDQPPCEDETAAASDPANAIGEELADAMDGLGAPAPPGEDDLTRLPGDRDAPDAGVQGLLPMVVASSAGGRFGPHGSEGGPASSGWWHGYTIVRMDASGDPRKTIVEQRPVFDWLSITAATHVLKPRQRVILRGEGREPIGVDVAPRYDAIDSHAITHRYDLVLADDGNPSVPRRDASGNYVEVPPSVGTIDRETGVVTAGAGRQQRTYAVAILSVDDKAATWPIAFEPAKGFRPRPASGPIRSIVRPPARPAQVRPPLPPPVVLNQPPAPTPPGTPPPPVPPINVPPINLPPPPSLPTVPPVPTGTATPTPPPPATPPAPPGDAGALPLSLQAPLTPISIVTTVIPPSPPPVNPAPPSGSAARKEARQRQAATAKSEEGGGDEQATGEHAGGETGSAEMTRADVMRPAPSYDLRSRDERRYSFTTVSHGEQASAWVRGALYGGMTTLTALVLALGWGIARPRPTRRHPPHPAPETARSAGQPRHR